ncbi:MAG: hypothetical protein V3U87_15180 [Methylococcaceae bacterium]
MPEWVAEELGGMDDKLNADFELTLDDYFGLDRENKQTFNKNRQAQDREKEIVMLLANHRIAESNFKTDDLKEIARESKFSFGEIKVIYEKHNQLLDSLNAQSSAEYGKGCFSKVLFYNITENK